jgi:hypothetical protein
VRDLSGRFSATPQNASRISQLRLEMTSEKRVGKGDEWTGLDSFLNFTPAV